MPPHACIFHGLGVSQFGGADGAVAAAIIAAKKAPHIIVVQQSF